MKRILSYLMPYRFRMLLGLVIKITGTFADLGLPWILAYILDDVIPTGKVNLILFWGFLMMILAVLARTFNILANRMASRVARNSVKQIRHDLFEKICSLSGSQTDFFTMPSLISRMTSDTYNIHQMIGMMQRLGVRAPLILIGGVLVTFSLEPVLTLVLAAIMPILGIIVFQVSKKGIPLYKKVQQAADKMVQTLRETISGIRVIKALSKTEYEIQRFSSMNEDVVQRDFRAGSIMAISGPCMNLLLNIGLTLVIVVGAYRVNSGASEPGKITAFLSYFTMILNAVLSITRIFVVYSKASASAGRIDEVLSAMTDLQKKERMKEGNKEFIIEFDQVSFGYHCIPHSLNDLEKKENISQENRNQEYIKIEKENRKQKNVGQDIQQEWIEQQEQTTEQIKKQQAEQDEMLSLKDVSFRLKKGEGLGIIGATGSGKTTIINLLMRFYDVTGGAIYIDGKNICSYSLQELRSLFGVVFQNDMIFADTIKENIAFGRDITIEQIKEAAMDACADSFIQEKENGYEYYAAIKGADFSGGQKQRILIARALAANPKILILDDSSSALDYKTDALLRQAIAKNYQDTTTIMIAQRISSVMQMEHIMVLEEGRIIGFGTHKELLKSCEVYREIYESQIGSDL